MNQPQALYRLQLLETSLDDAKARLEAIDATLHNNEAIKKARKNPQGTGQRSSARQCDSHRPRTGNRITEQQADRGQRAAL